MIVIDTNVLSEMMNPAPDPQVVAWFSRIDAREQAISATVAAELWVGAAIRPEGRRRRLLQARIDATIDGLEILPFNETAARHYAKIIAARQRAGRPITAFDAQVAATARAYGARLATRNTKDFTGCGVDLINPWNHEP